MALKAISSLANKYQTRASGAQGDYSTGMASINPQAWEQATISAAPTWEQGVQAAVANKTFASGVTGKGAKLVKRAADVGGQRYAQGTASAGPAWQAGFQIYYDTIASTQSQLSPRGPRGDPRNQQRSNAMATALHQRRVQRGS